MTNRHKRKFRSAILSFFVHSFTLFGKKDMTKLQKFLQAYIFQKRKNSKKYQTLLHKNCKKLTFLKKFEKFSNKNDKMHRLFFLEKKNWLNFLFWC